MSIASEINNYANGLSDAYDAVNDMSGIIPQDKNMNNLDTAIRTIPTGGSTPNDGVLTITQNGTTVQTFSANQSTNVTAALTDTTYSDFTGATGSTTGAHGLVPAPASGDQEKVLHGDGTWKDTTAKLVEMSYGESNAWAKFIAAYNAGSIVYCRASSNANPGTGSQTRKAFMAYVNNATNPTNVEFQYVRSQSSKTDSQQCDQVFVYTLTNASGGTWSVASRNMAPKINVSGAITKTFTSGANATLTIGADTMTGATSGAAGSAGIVPKPNSGDQGKFLKGDGTWATPTDTTYSDFTGATSSTAGANGLVPAPAAGDEGKVLQGDGTWVTPAGNATVFYINDSNDNRRHEPFMPYSVKIYSDSGLTHEVTWAQIENVFNSGAAVRLQWTGATAVAQYSSTVLTVVSMKKKHETLPFSEDEDNEYWMTAVGVTGLVSHTLNGKPVSDIYEFYTQSNLDPLPGASPVYTVTRVSQQFRDAGSYSSSEVATPYKWYDGKTIYKRTFKTDNITQAQTVVTHGISNFGALAKAEGVMYTSGQGYQPLDRVLPDLMSAWGWGLGDVNATTFTLFFGSSYTLSQITTWITLYYTKTP